MKIRIKFRKSGVMKFIGHLDIMRYFQKAMRRADIDICYSEGFSPHQIMSFAAPLGVGITSDGEYLDIEVHESKSTKEAMADLNATMVEGVEITGYVKLPDNAKTAMSLVAAADYKLFFKEGYEVPFTKTEAKQAILDYFITPSEVLITKQTKKSEKIMDLKQLVYDFKVEGTEEAPEFYINLCTGSFPGRSYIQVRRREMPSGHSAAMTFSASSFSLPYTFAGFKISVSLCGVRIFDPVYT